MYFEVNFGYLIIVIKCMLKFLSFGSFFVYDILYIICAIFLWRSHFVDVVHHFTYCGHVQ
jgi:hypothetical protein